MHVHEEREPHGTLQPRTPSFRFSTHAQTENEPAARGLVLVGRRSPDPHDLRLFREPRSGEPADTPRPTRDKTRYPTQLTAPRARKDGRLDLRLHRRRVDRREHGWGCGRVVRAPDGSDEVSHLPEETVAKNNGVCVCFLKFDISSLRERPAELRIESIAPPIIFVASKQASKHLPRTYKYSASMRAVQRRRLTRSIGPQYCRQSTYHTHTSH